MGRSFFTCYFHVLYLVFTDGNWETEIVYENHLNCVSFCRCERVFCHSVVLVAMYLVCAWTFTSSESIYYTIFSDFFFRFHFISFQDHQQWDKFIATSIIFNSHYSQRGDNLVDAAHAVNTHFLFSHTYRLQFLPDAVPLQRRKKLWYKSHRNGALAPPAGIRVIRTASSVVNRSSYLLTSS